MPDDADLMTVRAAAAQVGTHRHRLDRWIRDGLLPTHPSSRGALVSLAAVRALDDAAAERSARRAVGPREVPDDDAEYVAPSVAARQTGVPIHTVSYWGRIGQVATKPNRYGRLVRLADVEAKAAQRRMPAPGADTAP
jgi:predicted site-specific integrase-resolvase